MTTIVLRVYEPMEKIQGLMHDRAGKILNPTQKIKLQEFEYLHKFLPRFQMMGYVHVEFEDAYEIVYSPAPEMVALDPKEFDRLKKALEDRIHSVAPTPELSPMEKENQELKERMKRMEDRMEKLTSKETTSIPDPTPPPTIHVEEPKPSAEDPRPGPPPPPKESPKANISKPKK